MEFDSGEIFCEKYLIKSYLDRGTFARVFLAEHIGLRQQVALKIFQICSQEEYDHILRETRIMAAIEHRNIVSVYEAGYDPERNCAYIAMEYVDGAPLADYINGSIPLSLEQIFYVISEIARALEVFAEKGIIHRDIKPGNILVARDGRVKLSDFGIARAPRNDSGMQTNTINITNIMLGTPEYASPEQVQNGHNVDIRSDIYSLGICFYFLLTHKSPFAGRSVIETIDRVLNAVVFPPSYYNAAIPHLVNDLVMRMIDRSPARRPQSPGELLNEIASILAILRGNGCSEQLFGPASVRRQAPLPATVPLKERAPVPAYAPASAPAFAAAPAPDPAPAPETFRQYSGSREERGSFRFAPLEIPRVKWVVGLILLPIVILAGLWIGSWITSGKDEFRQPERPSERSRKRVVKSRISSTPARPLPSRKSVSVSRSEMKPSVEKKSYSSRPAAPYENGEMIPAERRKDWSKAPEGWVNYYEEGLRRARLNGKKLLVLFTGSDWCGPCKSLKKNVLDKEEFKQFAAEKFELVYINTTRAYQPQLQKKYNSMLRSRMTGSRGGVPCVVILDNQERVIETLFGYSFRAGLAGYMQKLRDTLAKPAGNKIRPARKKLDMDGLELSNNEFLIECGALIKYKKENVSRIIIPEGVKKIVTGAFYKSNVKEIILPASLEKIDSAAFSSCNIGKIVFKSPREIVSGNAFLESKISEFVFPEGSNYVWEAPGLYWQSRGGTMKGLCYANVPSSGVLQIPEGVTYIGSRACYRNKMLRKVLLPSSIKVIGIAAFGYCTNLEEVVFANDSKTGTIGQLAFINTKLKKIDLPDSVKSIDHSAFRDCRYLQEIRLPSSLESIGAYVFYNCRNLQLLNPPDPAAVKIGPSAFRGTPYEEEYKK